MSQRPLLLIVDDVPLNTQILAEALSSDYRIKVANSGAKALEIAQSDPQPQLILLDIMMPEMDGFEVCKKLKSDTRTEKTPIIFVTSQESETDEELGLNLGAVDYIVKPISMTVIKARIRNHLRLKMQADMLETLALTDALTNIPNRRRFDQELGTEWKRACREKTALSLIMIDIDYFKNYNDHYGHGAGDMCLQEVAAALTAGVSRPSDLVARIGGEEFAVILPGTGHLAAVTIAERMRNNVCDLKRPHAYSSASPFVSVSIGAATMRLCKKGGNSNVLLEEADKMLYQAKHNGRNQVCQSEIDHV